MSKTIELDYEGKQILSPDYWFHRITPNETNGTITVDQTGGQPLTWNFPADRVFNPAMSYIKLPYTVSAASGAGTYQYMPADCIPFWRIVDWSPTSGQPLLHIEDFDHFSKLSMRPSIHYDDFITFDPNNLFARSNNLVSQNKRPDGTNAAVHYDEPAFWTIGAANTALTGTLYIPLSRFVDTALATNKDMYLGQISTLQLTWKPLTQFCFYSTDPYNPTTGASALAAGVTMTINSALLLLACERNPHVVDLLKADFANGKHEMIIPFVKKINKTSYVAQSNNGVIVRLYPHDGFKIAKIYQGIFPNEYNITAGTNTNFLSTVLPAYGMGNTMYTNWNAIRRQENDLVLGTDDYQWQRKKFTGSCYLSNAAYQNAWVWIENFGEQGPKSEDDLPIENKLIGEDINTENIWEFNVTWAGNQTVNLYTFPVALKKLRASPMGVEVIP